MEGAARIAKEERGIIWYEHLAVEAELAKLPALPVFGAGKNEQLLMCMEPVIACAVRARPQQMPSTALEQQSVRDCTSESDDVATNVRSHASQWTTRRRGEQRHLFAHVRLERSTRRKRAWCALCRSNDGREATVTLRSTAWMVVRCRPRMTDKKKTKEVKK